MAPAIAVIVAATMIPTGLRHPSLHYIQSRFDIADFVNNLLLYMPLGIALSGSSLKRAFAYGLSLSTCAEVLQLGFVDRIPSFLDITSNTCGTILGYLAGTFLLRVKGWDFRSIRIPRPMAAVAVLVTIMGVYTLVHHHPQPDFGNWDPTFDLAIGNELSGDRPWAGTISLLQIYPFAMDPAQIKNLAQTVGSAGPGAAVGAKAASAVPAGGLLPPNALSQRYGRPLLSRQQESTVFDALVKRSQMTILVAMQPTNLIQAGPARIVTYSQDPASRNFTLGQIHDTLTFRVRTPDTGNNGANPALFSGPVLSLNHSSFVAAVYDGRLSKLYVDGDWVAQTDLSAKRPRLPWRILRRLPGSIPVRQVELIGAEMLLSSLLALGLFVLVGIPRARVQRWVAGAFAGAVVGGAIWIFGVTQAGLGSRIVVECVAAALVVTGSMETETEV